MTSKAKDIQLTDIPGIDDSSVEKFKKSDILGVSFYLNLLIYFLK